jgi:hypothetical protein
LRRTFAISEGFEISGTTRVEFLCLFKRLIVLFVAWLTAAAAGAQAQAINEENSSFAPVRRVIQTTIARFGIPSMAVAVSSHGRTQ